MPQVLERWDISPEIVTLESNRTPNINLSVIPVGVQNTSVEIVHEKDEEHLKKLMETVNDLPLQ